MFELKGAARSFHFLMCVCVHVHEAKRGRDFCPDVMSLPG